MVYDNDSRSPILLEYMNEVVGPLLGDGEVSRRLELGLQAILDNYGVDVSDNVNSANLNLNQSLSYAGVETRILQLFNELKIRPKYLEICRVIEAEEGLDVLGITENLETSYGREIGQKILYHDLNKLIKEGVLEKEALPRTGKPGRDTFGYRVSKSGKEMLNLFNSNSE